MSYPRPQYLFNCLDDVRRQLVHRDRIAVFLDLDGTLASITQTPQATRLKPETRAVLQSLTEDPRFQVSIVSGRAIHDLKQIIKLTNIVYVGNHGLEIEGSGVDFIHKEARNRAVLLIREVCANVSSQLRSLEGVIVEFKTLSASVHYRLAAVKEISRIRMAVHQGIAPLRDQLYMTEGKRVLELRPNVSWDKGCAVNWLLGLASHDRAASIYIGDDTTDEDAFRALPEGITINVGAASSSTAARYFVRSPGGVLAFLQCLPSMDSFAPKATKTLFDRAAH